MSKPLWALMEEKNETPKAYQAFLHYINLPPNERSTAKVAEILSCSHTNITRWASKFQWTKRARAYDEHQGLTALSVRTAALDDARKEHTQQMALLSKYALKIIAQELANFKLRQEHGDSVDPKALHLFVRSLAQLDEVARRNLALPTTYLSAPASDLSDVEEEIYYVGGE